MDCPARQSGNRTTRLSFAKTAAIRFLGGGLLARACTTISSYAKPKRAVHRVVRIAVLGHDVPAA